VTKLRGPSDSGQWVAHERLLADLTERHRGRRCRACVIAAVSGFGKTTLAAQWADSRRYRESYFEVFPGIWRHGDFSRINRRGGCYIYGRSTRR